MENDNTSTEEEVYTFTFPKKTIKKILLLTGVGVAAGVILTSGINSARREAELEYLRGEKMYELEASEDDESTENTSEKSE